MAKLRENAGGLGGRTARRESGLTAIKDQRMLARAIRGGWLDGPGRWDTNITLPELLGAKRKGPLTLKQKALLAVMRDVSSDNPRPRQIAASNVIKMEAQNQADEHKRSPEEHHHTHNVSVVQMAEEMRRDPQYIEFLRQQAEREDAARPWDS